MANEHKPIDFVYEKVSVEDCRKALDENLDNSDQDEWTNKRTPPETTLLAVTVAWLNDLPEGARPVEVARCYPRIVNDLCRFWKTPVRWERYMESLLVVRREKRIRRGFPEQILAELAALSAHHAALYPAAPEGAWSSVRR